MSQARSSVPNRRIAVLLAGCLLYGSLVFSQSQDHPLLSPFPDSELVDAELVEDINYRLVLGTLQRTRGVVVPQDSRRLRGDVTKLRYEVSPEFGGQDVLGFFRQQFSERGYTLLFRCSGRECGSSNYWANDIFRNRVLYGPQLNQHYLVWEAGDAHLVLYIITRGNRRLYAYLEIIEPAGTASRVQAPSSGLLDALTGTGSLVIPDLRFVNDRQLADTTVLAELAAEMVAVPRLRLYVVAHLDGDQELEQLLQRATVRAQTVRQQLLEAGVAGERLIARGVGPLAPSCSGTDCRERVELVVRGAPDN